MGTINEFGNVLPLISGFGSTFRAIQQTVNIVDNIARNPQSESQLALQQLQQRQNLQQNQLEQQANLERERLAIQSEQDEADRRSALRRAVSRQRANFGAQGVQTGGSSDAVLLGLFEESEEERERREQLDSLRRQSIDQNLRQSRALNLLQATQLAERNNLTSLF